MEKMIEHKNNDTTFVCKTTPGSEAPSILVRPLSSDIEQAKDQVDFLQTYLRETWAPVDGARSKDLLPDFKDVEEQTLNLLVDYVGTSWKVLGRHLGLKQANLEHIEMDNRHAPDQIFLMLFQWKQSCASADPVEVLKQAFRDSGFTFQTPQDEKNMDRDVRPKVMAQAEGPHPAPYVPHPFQSPSSMHPIIRKCSTEVLENMIPDDQLLADLKLDERDVKEINRRAKTSEKNECIVNLMFYEDDNDRIDQFIRALKRLPISRNKKLGKTLRQEFKKTGQLVGSRNRLGQLKSLVMHPINRLRSKKHDG